MTTLISLTRWEEAGNGRFLARWQTEDGITFDAIHDDSGKALSPVRPFGIRLSPPRLTDGQRETAVSATVTRHPAYDLADKGTAARPDLAKRMHKAAQLVEAGAVHLLDDDRAIVNSSHAYVITGKQCNCEWQKHRPGEHCSHSLAVRMARALKQPINEPLAAEFDEAEKEARSEAMATAKREAKIKRASQVESNAQQRNKDYKKWYHSGSGARRYVRKAMANGAETVRADIMQRAQPTLAQ